MNILSSTPYFEDAEGSVEISSRKISNKNNNYTAFSKGIELLFWQGSTKELLIKINSSVCSFQKHFQLINVNFLFRLLA